VVWHLIIGVVSSTRCGGVCIFVILVASCAGWCLICRNNSDTPGTDAETATDTQRSGLTRVRQPLLHLHPLCSVHAVFAGYFWVCGSAMRFKVHYLQAGPLLLVHGVVGSCFKRGAQVPANGMQNLCVSSVDTGWRTTMLGSVISLRHPATSLPHHRGHCVML
jgi:hypothetical protein